MYLECSTTDQDDTSQEFGGSVGGVCQTESNQLSKARLFRKNIKLSITCRFSSIFPPTELAAVGVLAVSKGSMELVPPMYETGVPEHFALKTNEK